MRVGAQSLVTIRLSGFAILPGNRGGSHPGLFHILPHSRIAWQWVICGGQSCADAVRATTCRGTVWNVSLVGGFRLRVSVILIPFCVCPSSPEVGAGCGNTARPDLWRGL